MLEPWGIYAVTAGLMAFGGLLVVARFGVYMNHRPGKRPEWPAAFFGVLPNDSYLNSRGRRYRSLLVWSQWLGLAMFVWILIGKLFPMAFN